MKAQALNGMLTISSMADAMACFAPVEMDTGSTTDGGSAAPNGIGPTLRIESVPISDEQTTGQR